MSGAAAILTRGVHPATGTSRTAWKATGQLGLVVLLLVLALATSSQLSRYELTVGAALLAYVALAQSWNLLAGFSGQISLGVSAFVGTGAYTMALLMLHAQFSWLWAMFLGTIAGGLLSVVLAPALLRLRGDYFAIGSLAAALALQAWLLNWSYAGGSSGLTLPITALPGLVGTYQVAAAAAAIALATLIVVRASPLGYRLAAVRDAEGAAGRVGVPATRQRLYALVLSSLLMSLAGTAFALQQISFEPNGMFGIGWTLSALLMTIVGGIGTLFGPVVGVIVIYYGISTELASYQTISLFLEGGLLIAIVRFAPQGLWPLVRSAVATAFKLLPLPERFRPAEGGRPSPAAEALASSSATTSTTTTGRDEDGAA